MADAKPKSPKKPTKKAGTARRSTTSSRTKKASGRRKPAEHEDEENTFENSEEPTALTSAQQSAILERLYRGASPAGACSQAGVSVEAFLQTVSEDPAFRAKVREITGVLSGNVMAVLYRTAMEGNVSAQQAWLKLFPPPSFTEPANETEPMTFDELLGDLSDDELVELARAVGVDLPHEVEANLGSEGLSYITEQISRMFAVDA